MLECFIRFFLSSRKYFMQIQEEIKFNKILIWGFGLDFGVKRHFQQYSSYIVAVSFIGGGNRSTRKKTTEMY